ncbi:MAG: metallophosphoesterase [Capnocytophaga sp.]|nr:metallophosphoesterase [Capnocytophaga sp.]
MKKLIYTTALLFGSFLSAQEEGAGMTPFQYEKSTGYKGKDIPTMTYWEDSFNFLVLGDFGRVGNYYQKDVARELGHAAIVLDADFILSVGDNFYPDGVQSTQDYHWISSFEAIYSDSSLYRPWYVALGNHDYRGIVQAQIDYSQVSRRWNLPERYYSKTFTLDNGDKVLMVVMDTNPYIRSYHKKPEKYLGINEQDTQKQTQWLEETLATKDASIKWKIVVGHHPLYSGGMRKDSKDTAEFAQLFADMFDKYKVNAYICGHEHDMQIIRPKGRYTTQLLSGAASETRKSGAREGTVYHTDAAGFLSVSILKDKMLVQVVKATDTTGEVVYKHEIKR